MAEISPTLIKTLRDRTGVGIGKCKEALEKTDGNLEDAISYLRKLGVTSAVKKEGRAANEGKIRSEETDQLIAIVEVNSETDFVANNEKFLQFLENITKEVAKTHPKTSEDFLKQKYSKDPSLTIDEYRATIVQMIGENIQIGRFKLVEKGKNNSVGVYSHMNGKIVCAVVIEGSSQVEDLARDIAMHTAAAAPDYLDPKQIPADVVSHEREIAKSQIHNKPADIIGKIVDGKINAFYDSVCLLRQRYVRDDKITIAQLVEKKSKEIGKPLSLTSFIRLAIGQK